MNEVSPSADLSWELLDRYYAGDSTPEETAAVHNYLVSHPEHGRVIDRLRSAMSLTVANAQPANISAMLAAVHDRITPNAVLRRLVRTLFDGSVDRAVAALLTLDDPQLNDLDIERLRQLIDQAKREGR